MRRERANEILGCAIPCMNNHVGSSIITTPREMAMTAYITTLFMNV